MARKFYTARDIDELYSQGIRSLKVAAGDVLTDLAYEQAHRLGLHLEQEIPDAPPAAPVRPYISQVVNPPVKVETPPVSAPAPTPKPAPASDLADRIRQAVNTRLGDKIEPALLDSIIARVLKSTGLK